AAAIGPIGELVVEPGSSCLSGCFNKPQRVVWARATPAVSENLERIPGEVRHRRSLPTVFGRLSLAGWLCLSSMLAAARIRIGTTTALEVRRLWAPAFAHGGNDHA